MALAPSAGRL